MDPELVVQAQAGDRHAFERLVINLAARFHGVAFNILRDRQLAEDATQQAMLSMWRDLHQLREPSRFEAWAHRLLVRACYAEATRRRRWRARLTRPPRLDPIDTTDDLAAVDERDRFDRAFRRLSVDHRVVIVLHHYIGLTVDDVAITLDIPAGTVRSRLDRAMAKLRLALVVDVPEAAAPQEARS